MLIRLSTLVENIFKMFQEWRLHLAISALGKWTLCKSNLFKVNILTTFNRNLLESFSVRNPRHSLCETFNACAV